jgi:hypothetical protein
MPAHTERFNNDIYVLRLSGVVLKDEFGNVQDKAAAGINVGVKPRVLAILENFEGGNSSAPDSPR